MKWIYPLLIAAVCIYACNNESDSSKSAPKSADTIQANPDTLSAKDSIGLTYFRDLMGKYPGQIKLFEREDLVSRLKKMMGSDFDFMKQNWETEVPIEISNGVAFTWGMRQHSGGDPGSALCADIYRNKLFTAIRNEGKIKTYSEGEAPVPPQLQDWMKGD